MSEDVRRVAVFTGTRAEYGLLAPVLRRLEQSPRVELSLLVAGAHLSLLHGMTIDAIEDDGFNVAARVEMVLASDTPSAITKSVGVALIDLAVRLEQLRPDLLVILGDRYEILAAAFAATLAGVPVAHIHGGEVTAGAFDDAIRHAVTKLSHLHFVATDEFAHRVAQLGEDPSRIHVVGAPALDVIGTMSSRSREDVGAVVGIELEPPVVVVAYHPSTIPGEDPLSATRAILEAVDRLGPATVVASLPNADPRFGEVRRLVADYGELTERAVAVSSLGHEVFLSLLRHADLVVGNSSSGIIEAPAVGTPAVNVGQRQEGRPLAPSVLSAAPEVDAIEAACRRGLDPEFLRSIEGTRSPYDRGVSVATHIVDIIESTDLPQLLRKRFVDLP